MDYILKSIFRHMTDSAWSYQIFCEFELQECLYITHACSNWSMSTQISSMHTTQMQKISNIPGSGAADFIANKVSPVVPLQENLPRVPRQYLHAATSSGILYRWPFIPRLVYLSDMNLPWSDPIFFTLHLTNVTCFSFSLSPILTNVSILCFSLTVNLADQRRGRDHVASPVCCQFGQDITGHHRDEGGHLTGK